MSNLFTNKYGLPILSKQLPINKKYDYILLHGQKLTRPIRTDLEDVHEYHYILKGWKEVYKIPYGERRHVEGIYTGYLDLFTPHTKIHPYNIGAELPESVKLLLRTHITEEIRFHYAGLDRYQKLLKLIR